MKYSIAFALVGAVYASPIALPQGVTSQISPSDPAPSGCSTDYSGSFGIAVMNMTMPAATMAPSATMPMGSAPVSQVTDGQPQATTAAPVSQITDGQPQASTAGSAVSQISDGQIQATTAPAVSQISDGQIQATTMTMTMQPMNQITDGQVQNQVMTVAPVSQISDGQIQATTAPAVSQISDGQIQATTAPAVSQISDGQIQATTAPAVSQISDGQIQATTAPAVSQISDGQIQASTSGAPVSQISDGQIQATTSAGVSQISDGQPQATASASAVADSQAAPVIKMVSCSSDDTLTLMLNGGVLTDNKGRTGYIAANYQFQFDNPPQAGAIYTAGWSVCGNGSLALGGSEVFYQCLSGSFYNLYDRNWAAQCNPVTLNTVGLVDC